MDKRKGGKRQKLVGAAATLAAAGSKARTVKDILASSVSPPVTTDVPNTITNTPTVNSDVQMKVDAAGPGRRPGPAKRKKQDSISLSSSLPTSNYRSSFTSENLGTMPISMASLTKQVKKKEASNPIKDPFEPDFDAPESPTKLTPSKGAGRGRGSPAVKRSAFGTTPDIPKSTCVIVTTASNSIATTVASMTTTMTSSVSTGVVMTTSAASSSACSSTSSSSGTSSTPPTLFPAVPAPSVSGSGGGDLTSEPLTNGPSSYHNAIAPPPRPAALIKSSSGLGSPVKGSAECAGGTGASCSMPTSMEQLLERQWEQGSAFLIEQGQHFDIASLLNCLHQLRQENQRLEEHITALTMRRDHLLAVNARLSLPLAPVNSPHTSAGGPSHGASPDTSGHQRSLRVNNYLPPENPAELGRNTTRSPAHTQSPAQNHIATASSTNQSPAGSHNTSLNSQNQSPEGRGNLSGASTVVTTSPSSSTSQPSMMTDAQKHQYLLQQQQQQLAAMGHNLTQEQQQTLMYQIMQQQQHADRATAAAAAAATHQSTSNSNKESNPQQQHREAAPSSSVNTSSGGPNPRGQHTAGLAAQANSSSKSSAHEKLKEKS